MPPERVRPVEKEALVPERPPLNVEVAVVEVAMKYGEATLVPTSRPVAMVEVEVVVETR